MVSNHFKKHEIGRYAIFIFFYHLKNSHRFTATIAASATYCPLRSVLAISRYTRRNRYFDPWYFLQFMSSVVVLDLFVSYRLLSNCKHVLDTITDLYPAKFLKLTPFLWGIFQIPW